MVGVKFDQGKDPYHLAPWDAIRATVKVMAFGAQKYGERNWEAGMDWGRVYSAAVRHLSAWWERDPADAETGYSHLWHAACCLLFLVAYELRGVGTDSRPQKEKALEINQEPYGCNTVIGDHFKQYAIATYPSIDRRKQHAGVVNYSGPLRRASDADVPATYCPPQQ